jgi:hypothetical protein
MAYPEGEEKTEATEEEQPVKRKIKWKNVL